MGGSAELVADGGGYDPGRASHAALLELRRSLERHPAVEEAVGDPPGGFTQLRADLDPPVLGATAESGTLTVRWYAGDSPDARPEYSFHYRDESGFDCGWHHEPNPHVDGWGHYQERVSSDSDYTYEHVTLASDHPVRVLWEVLERLEHRLGSA